MSKTILIMDMPIDCADCICSKIILGPSESGRCLKTGEIFDDWGKRQDWCPLREVPEKESKSCCSDDYDDGYVDGYNDCIDEILGGGEDRK